MNRKLVFGFTVAVVIYIAAFIISFKSASQQQNPEFQTYINEYKNLVAGKVANSIIEGEENQPKIQYQASSTGGTTSNFEGPQVHLKAIKFFDEILTHENIGLRLKHFDGVSAHFDPDHTYYGLPDVKISIQDVRLYEMEKGAAGQFLSLSSGSEPKPYKVYRKAIVDDSLGLKSRIFEMQLWLTEFDVNVDIRPDRDIPVTISDSEKETTKYPGYWYGSNQKFIYLKDLDKEHRDFRYGDLSFILEVIPDNSPIYVKTATGQTTKPDFAIGAIYCKGAKIGNEPNVQRISTNIHAGQPVFLNHNFDFGTMNENTYNISPNLESAAKQVLEHKTKNSNFIWNKPYYIKLFFNNLGTWRSGLFNQNQFHDQVSYSFLMPIFVVGSWDVIVPQEVLPEWNPPEPYIKKFTLKSLLPFWGNGFLGKIGSIVLVFLVLFFLISMFFPRIMRFRR